jgi:hypothetical protein
MLASNAKEMDTEIDIFEHPWWTSLFGHLLFLALSFMLVYTWYYARDYLAEMNRWKLLVLLVPPLLYFLFWFPNLFYLYLVPKRIVFKQDHIVIVDPFGQGHKFSYHEISRFRIQAKPGWSEPIKWISSGFRATMYFSNDGFKVKFNPDALGDFSSIVALIRSKGLDHVIQLV